MNFFKKLFHRDTEIDYNNSCGFESFVLMPEQKKKIRDKNGRFVNGHPAYYDPAMKRNKKGQFVKGKRNVRLGK